MDALKNWREAFGLTAPDYPVPTHANTFKYSLESLVGISGILLGSAIFSLGLILIPILGLTIHKEKTLLRVVDTLVIAGLIAWLALLAITYFSPTMQHF